MTERDVFDVEKYVVGAHTVPDLSAGVAGAAQDRADGGDPPGFGVAVRVTRAPLR